MLVAVAPSRVAVTFMMASWAGGVLALLHVDGEALVLDRPADARQGVEVQAVPVEQALRVGHLLLGQQLRKQRAVVPAHHRSLLLARLERGAPRGRRAGAAARAARRLGQPGGLDSRSTSTIGIIGSPLLCLRLPPAAYCDKALLAVSKTKFNDVIAAECKAA
jgi:hypothetical protein